MIKYVHMLKDFKTHRVCMSTPLSVCFSYLSQSVRQLTPDYLCICSSVICIPVSLPTYPSTSLYTFTCLPIGASILSLCLPDQPPVNVFVLIYRTEVNNRRTGRWNMDYKLPAGMTCSQCVIQWKYHAGYFFVSFITLKCNLETQRRHHYIF